MLIKKGGKGSDGGGAVRRGEVEGKRGGGGAEETEPPPGDKGHGGGVRWRNTVEDFFEELVAEKGIHFGRVNCLSCSIILRLLY